MSQAVELKRWKVSKLASVKVALVYELRSGKARMFFDIAVTVIVLVFLLNNDLIVLTIIPAFMFCLAFLPFISVTRSHRVHRPNIFDVLIHHDAVLIGGYYDARGVRYSAHFPHQIIQVVETKNALNLLLLTKNDGGEGFGFPALNFSGHCVFRLEKTAVGSKDFLLLRTLLQASIGVKDKAAPNRLLPASAILLVLALIALALHVSFGGGLPAWF